MTGVIQPTSGAIECSLLSTRESDFGRGSLSLGQERRPILLFKNEGAAPAYGKRIEDAFVSLARNRAGLATFSIDETNDRSTWGACRARRPSWARRSLRCDLLLFAGRTELQLCFASFRGMADFVFQPPLRLARDVTVRTLDDAAEFARTYVGPRLPHRRDRLVRRLEEISDEASARVAARAFRAWAIAEGLLAQESLSIIGNST
jgi:hypothetical protein